MAKLTEEQWSFVRDIWESDASVSFAVMAKKVGIGKSTLIDRCKKYEWSKLDTATPESYLDADYSFLATDQNANRPTDKKTDRPIKAAIIGWYSHDTAQEQSSRLSNVKIITTLASKIGYQLLQKTPVTMHHEPSPHPTTGLTKSG